MATITVTCGTGISGVAWRQYNSSGSQIDSGTFGGSKSWTASSGYLMIYPNRESGYNHPIYYTRTDGYVQTITNSDGSDNDRKISFTQNKTGTVTATYVAPATYTISYNANGGNQSTVPASQTKTHGVDLTLSSDVPSRANSNPGNYTVTLKANYAGGTDPQSLTAARTTKYTIKDIAWNTESDGSGSGYRPGGRYARNAGATLYAQWDSTTSTASVNLPTPTRTGYDFQGWSTDSGATSGITGSYTPAGNVTLYAIWKIKTYTISYDANGGSGAPSAQTKTHGVNLTLSSTEPRRTGYDFLYWQDTTTYKLWYPGDSYDENRSTTLKAQWRLKTYVVSYDANGGTGAPASQIKYYGENLILTTDEPTRTGYNFVNWYDGTDYYSPGGVYTANSPVTLYAQWNRKKYTITFDANGGSGAPSPQIKEHDITLTLSSVKPTREGYRFLYWYCAPYYYAPGGNYVANSDGVMVAQWDNNLEFFYWHGSDSADAIAFSSGASVSAALTASAWNNMIAKMNELRALLGQSASTIPTVSAGSNITAVAFNQLRAAIGSTTGAGTLPGAVSKGDTITPSLFNGAGSLKSALNTAINAYNNS